MYVLCEIHDIIYMNSNILVIHNTICNCVILQLVYDIMYCLRTYIRGTSMRMILSSYKQINETTAQMDVSINGGTQKWTAKKGKSYENPILGNPPNSAKTSKNVQNNVSSEGWSLSLLSLLSPMPKAEKKVMLRRSLLVRVRAACG